MKSRIQNIRKREADLVQNIDVFNIQNTGINTVLTNHAINDINLSKQGSSESLIIFKKANKTNKKWVPSEKKAETNTQSMRYRALINDERHPSRLS
jgi:hypothetical protein